MSTGESLQHEHQDHDHKTHSGRRTVQESFVTYFLVKSSGWSHGEAGGYSGTIGITGKGGGETQIGTGGYQ